jgi:multidrug resistance efflux pump
VRDRLIPRLRRGEMADGSIVAGMTAEQADADIAARERKVEQLEATLKLAKDDLRQARSERKRLDEPAPAAGDGVEADAGAAVASGRVS